jgi:hypothetical protein
MTGNQIDSVERASPDILAGLILIFAALGSLIAAAHHPVVKVRERDELSPCCRLWSYS